MELENFKKEMRILGDRKAEAYRKLYINKYINTDSKETLINSYVAQLCLERLQ